MSWRVLLAGMGLWLIATTMPACSSEQPQSPVPAPQGAAPRPMLSIGAVTSDPKTEIETLQPFATYVAARLSAFGIGDGRVITARTPDELGALMRRDAVDVYLDSPFSAALVRHEARARPILRRWKHGEAVYQSVIFVRVDSAIDTIDGLAGRVLAVESPHSTTGYFLPRKALFEAGYDLVHRVRPSARVAGGEVGFAFTADDESTMAWVLQGRAAAGAIDRGKFLQYGGARLDELKVIWESEELPRQLVMLRPGLDPGLAAAIEETLLTMEDDEEGRQVLQGFEGTTRFDRLEGPPEAILRSLLDSFALMNGEAPAAAGCPGRGPGGCR
jgi:phosphonate transport system substrate-binding protein